MYILLNFMPINKFSNLIVPALFFIILSSCSQKDPTTGEIIRIEPNPDKKAREFAAKQGGLLGDIGKSNSGTNFEFTTSNVLWRATLKSLDFLPLVNADYSGGIIIYDWYSNKGENQSIKLSVKFLSNELKSSSVIVTGHKKICDDLGKCFVEKLNNKFTDEIKESVISTARELKIEDSKKVTK